MVKTCLILSLLIAPLTGFGDISGLLADLRSNEPAKTRVALLKLKRLSVVAESRKEVSAVLVRLLTEGDPMIQRGAADALGAWQTAAAVTPLCEFAKSAKTHARGAALSALARNGTELALECLVTELKASCDSHAIQALHQLSPEQQSAVVEQLIPVLDAAAQSRLTRALDRGKRTASAQVTIRTKPDLAELRALAEQIDLDPLAVLHALRAAGLAGEAEAIRLLQEGHYDIACQALADIGTAAALPHLATLAKSDKAVVRRMAQTATAGIQKRAAASND
ncbi:MAG TPA: hypothetical protein DCR55_02140 [Lentisphaeria bacterium]|jgi:HEAT repeat protein|nr:hypothetical protein [Lentisphaeria bacterium]